MKTHKNTFLIREAAWGIVIIQEGYVKEYKSISNELLIISKSDDIYLDLPNNQLMSKEYKQLLISGFLWVQDKIRKKNIVVVIDNLDINPSDFQKEGLFFSMAEWLSTYYDFELPSYEVTFNKNDRAYEFKIL